MKAQAIAFFEDLADRVQSRRKGRGLVFFRPDERVGIHRPGDKHIAFRDLRQVIDRNGLGLDLEDHFFPEDVAYQALIQSRETVEGETVGQFSRAHPEKTAGVACDQGIDLPWNISGIYVDRDERDIQIILQDAIGAVERAVGLRVEDPVLAAKVIRSRGRTGLQEGPLEICEPEFFLAGGEGRFSDVPEKGVLVFYERDRNAAESPQDAFGERRLCGIFFKINMIDLGNLFRGHVVL